MMSTKVWLYRPLLAMPGGKSYVFGTAGLFVLYGFIVLWVTRTDDPVCRTAVKVGTPLGLIAGVIQIAHLTQEEFWDLGKVGNDISGFGLLLCTFALWGMAGHRAARGTGAVRSGAMAGLWSAIVTMSMLILFGFFVEFYLATPKPEYVATWGEFKRSGWTTYTRLPSPTLLTRPSPISLSALSSEEFPAELPASSHTCTGIGTEFRSDISPPLGYCRSRTIPFSFIISSFRFCLRTTRYNDFMSEVKPFRLTESVKAAG